MSGADKGNQPLEIFLKAFQSAPCALILVDQDGMVVSANHEAETLFGYSRDQLESSPSERLFPERCRSDWEQERRACLSDKEQRRLGHHAPMSGVHSSGREFPIRVCLAPVSAAGDRFAVASVVDESELQKVERQPSDLAALVEAVHDVIISRDLEGNVRSWSRGAQQVLGYSAEDMVGRPLGQVVRSSYVENTDQLLEQLQQGETRAFKALIRVFEVT